MVFGGVAALKAARKDDDNLIILRVNHEDVLKADTGIMVVISRDKCRINLYRGKGR